MFRAVDMRTEFRTIFFQFTNIRQGKNLKSAAVGQYGPFPTDETMQATRSFQNIQTGTQKQMIRISENDLRANIIGQVALMNALYRSLCPDGHKHGRCYLAVVGRNNAAPGRTGFIAIGYPEIHLSNFMRKDRLFMYESIIVDPEPIF
jgi:hypothetical protein